MHPRRRKIDSFSFAAAKPTAVELHAQLSASNQAGAAFLKLDLETALIFTAIARQSADAFIKGRNRLFARRAYDAVRRFAGKVRLSSEDAHILTVNLGRLKSDLQKLGEIF
jgi:hypothetical protein